MGFATNSESLTILSYLYVFVATLTKILNAGFGLEECKFPAIFNFGDSNSDTGGFAAAFKPPNPPYGETYNFNLPFPSGRFCDGRLIIDFIAKEFNLPYLSPYLDSLGSNFTHGANFATTASTICLPTRVIPQGNFSLSPFYLDIQFQQFLQFKIKSHYLRKQGGLFAELMPLEEFFGSALYTFDIGQNDIGGGFFQKSIPEVNASIPHVVNEFYANVKNVYDLGGRIFWIHNTGPIGCLAFLLQNFPSYKKDRAGCLEAHNEVAQYFNYKLKETVAQLREDLPFAVFTYVDIYSVKYSLFTEPETYGFEKPLTVCCGYGGGEYNYDNTLGCGDAYIVNGTERIVGSCNRPSVRVDWDGIHYTEAANKFVFDQISSGAFSDPPIPLKSACHKTIINLSCKNIKRNKLIDISL